MSGFSGPQPVTPGGSDGALAGATFIGAAGETAVAGELTIVSCNDEDDNIVVDLPASPSAGDTVRLVNVSTEDYDVVAGRNGSTINFAESDFAAGGTALLPAVSGLSDGDYLLFAAPNGSGIRIVQDDGVKINGAPGFHTLTAGSHCIARWDANGGTWIVA